MSLSILSGGAILKEDYKEKVVNQLPKLGAGDKMEALKAELAKKGAKHPGAVEAYLGTKFSKLPAKGR